MDAAMHPDEEADRHWAAVSNLTQIAHTHHVARRSMARRRVRIGLGLTLVRAGLAIAPIGVDDVETRLGSLGS